jgi:toxin-antitoxin system PIN domain toxin
MITWLLEGNVLAALTLSDHQYHDRVRRWWQATAQDRFATCPVTEGTLLRLQMMLAQDKSAAAAWAVLVSLRTHPRHEFWPANFSYIELSPTRLTGHRQITDAWLAELARRQGGKLATLDEPLAALWPDVSVLVPV